MAYKKIETKLPGVVILEPQVFGDHRGWFMESWSEKNMEEIGLKVNFVQDNQSFTAKKGTLRGIHYQQNPMAQAKLVRVVHGAVVDIAVDIRKGSPTFGKYVGIELSDVNHFSLFIPQGCAHGFISLEDNTITCYKCDRDYLKDNDATIRWDDPDLAIKWPVDKVDKVVLSDRDAAAMSFSYFCDNYGGL